MSLERIRIVLVATSLGGNIGGCARAMKNMGLRHLVLVAPQDFPSNDATARAAGAEDVLANAQVCTSLEEAIADCQWVVGTSARDRRISWPQLSLDEAARRAVSASSTSQEVAIVFGRERTGLTNDELDRCQALVTIPTDPEFASLNLACAVQVVAYEIYRAELVSSAAPAAVADLDEPRASQGEVERFYQHLEQAMIETGFLDPQNPRLLMRRLMRLFNRVDLTVNEVNILRGILTSFQQLQKRL